MMNSATTSNIPSHVVTFSEIITHDLPFCKKKPTQELDASIR